MHRIRVWDIPTRLVHWSLVALVAFSWWTAENHHMDWHRYSGYAMLGVLIFRVYWGLVGSFTARFANFVRGPSAVIGYMRGTAYATGKNLIGQNPPGHNPLGALSVVVLLLLLIAQVGLGLFAVDVDGLESGPLSYLVSFDTGRACAEIHEWVFNVLMLFITVHVAAIFYYLLFRRDNLIAPMVTGSKEVPDSEPQPKLAAWWAALLGAALSGAVTWWIV